MKKIVNRAEFEALIERYESITIEDIENEGEFCYRFTIMEITGFGSRLSCSLCQPTTTKPREFNCDLCIWSSVEDSHSQKDIYCSFHETYKNIAFADAPQGLLRAVKARAKYMREVLNKFDHENKKDNN